MFITVTVLGSTPWEFDKFAVIEIRNQKWQEGFIARQAWRAYITRTSSGASNFCNITKNMHGLQSYAKNYAEKPIYIGSGNKVYTCIWTQVQLKKAKL